MAAPLPDGRVLVAGGVTDSFVTIVASAEIFDPATDTFSSAGVGDMTAARASAVASSLPDGRVLIAGGRTQAPYPIESAGFNPATGTFTGVGSMAVERSGATAASLGDGRVLVAGGLVTSALDLSSAEAFDPQTNTFSSEGIGSMGTPRFDAVSAPLPGGRALIAGGTLGLNVPAARQTAELYGKPFTFKLKGTKLQVDVPAPGTIAVTPPGAAKSAGAAAKGKKPRLKSSKASKGRPGTIVVRLKLNGAAKKAMRANGAVKLKARVTLTTTGTPANCFTPDTPCSGDQSTYFRKATLKIKGKRKP